MSSWGWVLLVWPLVASSIAVLISRGLVVADRAHLHGECEAEQQREDADNRQ